MYEARVVLSQGGATENNQMSNTVGMDNCFIKPESIDGRNNRETKSLNSMAPPSPHHNVACFGVSHQHCSGGNGGGWTRAVHFFLLASVSLAGEFSTVYEHRSLNME